MHHPSVHHTTHHAAVVPHHRGVEGRHAALDQIGHFRGMLLERRHGFRIGRGLGDDDAFPVVS